MKQEIDFYRGYYVEDIQIWSRIDGPNRIIRRKHSYFKRWFMRHLPVYGLDIEHAFNGRYVRMFHNRNNAAEAWAESRGIDIEDMTEDEFITMLLEI